MSSDAVPKVRLFVLVFVVVVVLIVVVLIGVGLRYLPVARRAQLLHLRRKLTHGPGRQPKKSEGDPPAPTAVVATAPTTPSLLVFTHQQLDLLQYFANAYPHVEGSILAGVLQNVGWNAAQGHGFLASAMGPPVVAGGGGRREDVFSQLARAFPEMDAAVVWGVLESMMFDEEAAMARLRDMQ